MQRHRLRLPHDGRLCASLPGAGSLLVSMRRLRSLPIRVRSGLPDLVHRVGAVRRRGRRRQSGLVHGFGRLLRRLPGRLHDRLPGQRRLCRGVRAGLRVQREPMLGQCDGLRKRRPRLRRRLRARAAAAVTPRSPLRSTGAKQPRVERKCLLADDPDPPRVGVQGIQQKVVLARNDDGRYAKHGAPNLVEPAVTEALHGTRRGVTSPIRRQIVTVELEYANGARYVDFDGDEIPGREVRVDVNENLEARECQRFGSVGNESAWSVPATCRVQASPSVERSSRMRLTAEPPDAHLRVDPVAQAQQAILHLPSANLRIQ